MPGPGYNLPADLTPEQMDALLLQIRQRRAEMMGPEAKLAAAAHASGRAANVEQVTGPGGQPLYVSRPRPSQAVQYVPYDHPPGPAPEGYFDAAIAHRAPIVFQMQPTRPPQSTAPAEQAVVTTSRNATPADIALAHLEEYKRQRAAMMARSSAASNAPLLLGVPGGRY